MSLISTTFIYSLADPRTPDEIRYVGKANDVKRRLRHHVGDVSDTYKCRWVRGLIKDGLRPKIEIIDIVNIKEWSFWEMHYISLYKSWGFRLTNTCDGGNGSESISAETRIKIGKAHKGRIISPETREKMRKAHTGKKLSKEHIAKMVKHRTGKKASEETKNKMKEWRKLNPFSQEFKDKVSIRHTGKVVSQETRARLSASLKGKRLGQKDTKERILKRVESSRITREKRGYKYFPKEICRKDIICVDVINNTEMQYNGIVEASKILKLHRSSIQNNLSGLSKIVDKQYKFKYKC